MVILFFTKLKILLKSVVVRELILKRFVMPDLCRNAVSRLTGKLTATMHIYQTLLKLPVAVLTQFKATSITKEYNTLYAAFHHLTSLEDQAATAFTCRSGLHRLSNYTAADTFLPEGPTCSLST